MTRILVIKLGALGDFVQAFGAFASIRAANPHASITLLTTAPFVAFAQETPWFDNVVTDERPSLRNPLGLLRLSRNLRGFDQVFDLQTSGRSKSYFKLSDAGSWCGISKGCSHPHANPSRNDMHTLARLDDQLRSAGITPIAREVPAWLKTRGPHINGRYAVLVPGAAPHRPRKRWPVSRFADIASALADRGITPVIVGGDADIPLGQDIHAACRGSIDLTGKTSLPDLAGVLGHAEIVIGNDTGPMHLAAAMDTPCLTLFSGDSDPRLTAPLTISPQKTNSLIVADLALLPASRVEALLPA
jgi:ADP-heptose:LPS heptosyltransferase